MKKYLYLFYCIAFTIGCPFYAQAQIINAFAGNGFTGYTGDGAAATLARLHAPTCIAQDGAGNVYINDQVNNCVRKVTPAGIISTVAGGNLSPGFGGDGGPATNAMLNHNWGMAVDSAGNIFIADQNNHCIRKVNTAGIINTIAGNVLANTSTGDGGPATDATLSGPIGITVDRTGNVYFADANFKRVRKISTSGIISTVAGGNVTTSFGGDGGPATNASLSYVYGLATDNNGNLYLCDGANNRVRKVNAGGIITTIAGNGAPGFAGDNGPATTASLNLPTGVFVTANGTIFIADCNNNCIRKISPAGIITTIAGTGAAGYNGDNIPATAAQLYLPLEVMVDTLENVYCAEQDARVRKISNVLSFTAGDSKHLPACQNSVPIDINAALAALDIYSGQTDTWALFAAPVHGIAMVNYTTTSTGGIMTPTGLTYTPASGYIGDDSFKVKVSNPVFSDIITIYFRVDPSLTTGTITGPSSVCVGSTITLSNTLPDGVWSTGPLATLVDHTLSCDLTGVAPGNDTVKFTITNGCGTIFTSVVVTINPLPDAGIINGPAAVCKGSAITLTETQPGGTWSSSSIKADITPAGVVTGVTPGTVTIIYTVANAWCTSTVLHPVTIEVFPDAGTILGPSKFCAGDKIVLTNAVDGGAWGSSAEILVIESGTVTGSVAGVGDISYSVTNSCGTAVTVRTVTINPLPNAPVISENQGLLSVPPVYTSYQWYVNGNVIPGEIADTSSTQTSGTYNVMVTNQFGCTISSSTLEYSDCVPNDIVIYPNPTVSMLYVQWCKKVTLKLMCDDGKEVTINKQVNKIDMSDLPNAVYILTIYDIKGNKLKTKRITKLTK